MFDVFSTHEYWLGVATLPIIFLVIACIFLVIAFALAIKDLLYQNVFQHISWFPPKRLRWERPEFIYDQLGTLTVVFIPSTKKLYALLKVKGKGILTFPVPKFIGRLLNAKNIVDLVSHANKLEDEYFTKVAREVSEKDE